MSKEKNKPNKIMIYFIIVAIIFFIIILGSSMVNITVLDAEPLRNITLSINIT